MLICRFSAPRGPDQLMAPVSRIRIMQAAVYANDEQKPASVYCDGTWRFRGQLYTGVSIEGPLIATLRGADGDVHCGTYRKIWIAEGVLQAPSGTIAALAADGSRWRDAASGREAIELRLELRPRDGKRRF